MNYLLKIFPVILLTFLSCVSTAQESAPSCKVTYIANEGFLAETTNHKILFDALFGGIKGNWCEQPGDSVLNLMLNGIPPFDNIAVALISHRHSDHFKEKPAVDFLKSNVNALLVCPGQVNEILMKNPDYNAISGRIISLKNNDTTIQTAGISIRAMKFSHGSYFETDSATGQNHDLHKDVQNYGYLVESDGFTLFHSGDCSASNNIQFEDYNLKNNYIDAAFFDRTFLRKEGMEIISSLNTGNIVFMHIEPGRTEYYKSFMKDFPQLTVFDNKLDSKIIKKQ